MYYTFNFDFYNTIFSMYTLFPQCTAYLIRTSVIQILKLLYIKKVLILNQSKIYLLLKYVLIFSYISVDNSLLQ